MQPRRVALAEACTPVASVERHRLARARTDGLRRTTKALDGVSLFLAMQELQYSGTDFVRLPATIDAARRRDRDRLEALLAPGMQLACQRLLTVWRR
jgi:hypothetical protein